MVLCYGSPSKPIQALAHDILYVMDKEAEAQRGSVTCLPSHAWWGAEPGFKLSVLSCFYLGDKKRWFSLHFKPDVMDLPSLSAWEPDLSVYIPITNSEPWVSCNSSAGEEERKPGSEAGIPDTYLLSSYWRNQGFKCMDLSSPQITCHCGWTKTER